MPLGTNILTLAPGRYSVDQVPNTEMANKMNLPVTTWHYEIDVLAAINATGLVSNYKVIIVYPRTDVVLPYINIMNYEGNWTGWTLIPTATSPQEYDLPLAAGATSVGAGYKNTYSKDQFGIVRVWFSIHFETLPAINQIVFQLPAGFKPSAMCCGSAYLSMGVYYQASINIDANGNGFVGYGSITHSGAINMHGFIEFPAVS